MRHRRLTCIFYKLELKLLVFMKTSKHNGWKSEILKVQSISHGCTKGPVWLRISVYT